MPARCFPDPLPEWVRQNELRRAEIKVYDALRTQLPSTYTLFYSRPWVGTNPDGTEREGEADFVIASAHTGFLVIEVKGGRVGREQSGEWYSIDGKDRRHAIKDPGKQARGSKHQILGQLRAHPRLQDRWIGMGSAV